MSFAPPSGPPPPSVPEGWKAQFDDRYKQWFYVDLRTGRSQWERPEGPTYQEDSQRPPSGPPPSYDASSPGPRPSSAAAGGDKKPLGSRNPYNSQPDSTLESDARLAAQLQAEEEAQARRRSPMPPAQAQSGAASDYYAENSSSRVQSPQGPSTSPAPKQERSRGFLGKLMGRHSGGGSSSSSAGGMGYSRPPQQAAYGYPQAGYGGYPPPQQAGYGYSSYPAQGGYYAQQQAPQRRHNGMGTAGAAALGVGGGLLGGFLLADAVEDLGHDFDGPPPGDYGGGGFDGGDFGGDDFGGDF
ncbi:uncharacterized protein AKAW2_40671A [Aspergillus luchuensis]|uniref:Uncharacterized protein n=1 Tax=Aspergillus kawachii TaxID=1069201 RepID=A0A7R7ZY20_ASPKA|nr:uncharacterized protein AKAW2_40671A [Aspergillus luchuensis]BCR98988.1 hypothetical protein AKAW2_40671A [Aspergillus luchuensis]BCS11300.1 hypothetical protein ALUC_40640A [Aspergillus luchuensis]GAA88158.1 WW domain protein [Aspergillus luchuensis IFO 4308]